MSDWEKTREAFEGAAEWFVSIMPLAIDHLDESGLGEWSIRDLIGHTSRALSTLESYLAKPATWVDVNSPVKYFTRILASGDPVAIAQRGREAGEALGNDPALSVRALTERVLRQLRAADENALVTTPIGGMRLADYLPTRTFELTIHTCDLARALGQPLEVPKEAAAQSLAIIGELAIQAGTAALLLLSVTGRQTLPTGFSVLNIMNSSA